MRYILETLISLLYWLGALITAMIGYSIHGSGFWAVMNFLFAPLAWAKWLICHEVCLSIIKHTFDFFLK
jgi:hypothetical protein